MTQNKRKVALSFPFDMKKMNSDTVNIRFVLGVLVDLSFLVLQSYSVCQ